MSGMVHEVIFDGSPVCTSSLIPFPSSTKLNTLRLCHEWHAAPPTQQHHACSSGLLHWTCKLQSIATTQRYYRHRRGPYSVNQHSRHPQVHFGTGNRKGETFKGVQFHCTKRCTYARLLARHFIRARFSDSRAHRLTAVMSTQPASHLGIWDNSVPNQSPKLVIVSIVFFVISSLVMMVRFAWRWAHNQRGWDDVMALLAYVSTSIHN